MDVKDTLTKGSHMFDRVHDLLWDMIIKGEIKPGERLKDSDWSVRLSLSRTPVREAMRKLQQEGVLLPLVSGGYQVRTVSNNDLTELYTCRAALESMATELASQRMKSHDLARLAETIYAADEAINKEELDIAFALNSSFHKQIAELADNSHLNFLSETLNKLVLFYRSALLNRVKSDPQLTSAYQDRLRIKQDAHRAIVAAMVAGKHKDAGDLMREHVLLSIKELTTQ
ncbi:GntR family transcriptional regulator [Paraburkholderia sediminicola]|uniref:GntR family transcriptional regulator n=1 Tax=Paraburkholderia sediminicola TaxID=458836 RepID=UPI0038BA2312